MNTTTSRALLVGLAAGIALFVPASAWAGDPQVREGFWIGFGAGYGWADVSCDECGDGGDREGSITGFVKLGGTLNERVLLGVETNVWTKEQDDVRVTLGSLAGTVTLYPQASSGFFLKAGVGLSYLDTGVRAGSVSLSASKTGWGFMAGLGYDLRLDRNVSITPCVNYYYGKPGDLTFEGETVAGWKQNVIDVGIGVTFH